MKGAVSTSSSAPVRRFVGESSGDNLRPIVNSVQAVVFDHDRRIRLVERPSPLLAASKVLLRPSHVGICGTDLHADELDHFRPGVVMGHEFSAHVAATESSASRFSEGSLVVVNPNGNVCGECEECLAGRFNLCHSGIFERGIGVHEDGGMAEFVVVSERVLFPVPPGVSEPLAAWTEPVATAVRAVRRSGASAESSVLIVGGGSIGLLVLQVLRHAGVRRVGIVEPSGYRRGLARRTRRGSHLFARRAGYSFAIGTLRGRDFRMLRNNRRVLHRGELPARNRNGGGDRARDAHARDRALPPRR